MSDIDYDILRIQSVVSITAALITAGKHDSNNHAYTVREAINIVDQIMEKESYAFHKPKKDDELPGSDLGDFVR